MSESVEVIKNETTDDDPYAYLDRGDFTSENFKIEIKNLPKYYGINVNSTRPVYVRISYNLVAGI